MVLLLLSMLGCMSPKTPAGPTGSAPTGEAATRCEAITASIRDAGFADKVTVTCDDMHAWISSDTYPDHTLMTGITGTNEQIPVPAAWSAPVSLRPSGTTGTTSIDAALGVAVNGVPIYDYSSQGTLDLDHYDPRQDVVLSGQLDICNGHAGRGDDYHYHATPTCMVDVMPNKDSAPILGWGFDGYPLYGPTNPDGSAVGALDVCHGTADATYGYRYHTSASPPYVMQCLRGDVDLSILPRVPPLRAIDGGDKPSGTPPQGGVQGLTHTLDATTGTRRMTYAYQGKPYYISYAPGSKDNCWRFTMDTVSNGQIDREYCR